MNNTLIVPTNVEGNITSCKIENEQVSVQKNSVWSLQKQTTYVSYDVCNKQTIKEYTVPGFTEFGLMSLVFVGVIIFAVIFGLITRDYY